MLLWFNLLPLLHYCGLFLMGDCSRLILKMVSLSDCVFFFIKVVILGLIKKYSCHVRFNGFEWCRVFCFLV